MPREITQREVGNGDVMRALEAGESFIVTRNGVPVGELTPIRRKRFVSKEQILAAFANAPKVDYNGFRADVDPLLSQDPTPKTQNPSVP